MNPSGYVCTEREAGWAKYVTGFLRGFACTYRIVECVVVRAV